MLPFRGLLPARFTPLPAVPGCISMSMFRFESARPRQRMTRNAREGSLRLTVPDVRQRLIVLVPFSVGIALCHDENMSRS
jgi:hypothetical protein